MDIILTHLFTFFLGFALSSLSAQVIAIYNNFWEHLTKVKEIFNFSNLYFSNAKLLQSVHAEILNRYQVEETYDESTWQRQGYEAFAAQLVDKERIFPCIYGTKGYKANELDFLFLPSEELATMDVAKIAAKGIVEYHKFVQSRGRNTSLVLMTPLSDKGRSVEEYHKLFWAFLHRLRRLDPKPWPRNIPQNTTAERWCFNFDDTSSFIAVLTPAHRQRQSRYAANLCMIYQPRYIFDALFTSEKNRISATKTVRNLLDRYDAIPHSPDISDYAKEGTTESRQYFLLDENKSAVCPYKSLDAEVSSRRE